MSAPFSRSHLLATEAAAHLCTGTLDAFIQRRLKQNLKEGNGEFFTELSAYLNDKMLQYQSYRAQAYGDGTTIMQYTFLVFKSNDESSGGFIVFNVATNEAYPDGPTFGKWRLNQIKTLHIRLPSDPRMVVYSVSVA